MSKNKPHGPERENHACQFAPPPLHLSSNVGAQFLSMCAKVNLLDCPSVCMLIYTWCNTHLCTACSYCIWTFHWRGRSGVILSAEAWRRLLYVKESTIIGFNVLLSIWLQEVTFAASGASNFGMKLIIHTLLLCSVQLCVCVRRRECDCAWGYSCWCPYVFMFVLLYILMTFFYFVLLPLHS